MKRLLPLEANTPENKAAVMCDPKVNMQWLKVICQRRRGWAADACTIAQEVASESTDLCWSLRRFSAGKHKRAAARNTFAGTYRRTRWRRATRK